MRSLVIVTFFLLPSLLHPQIRYFPYTEDFDSVIAPALPVGWISSTNRSSSGDFITTTSAFRSDSNAVISSNASISQSLVSPIVDFSNKDADSLEFYERRSSTHTSGMIIEASTDEGGTYLIQLGDTLKNPGTTAYVLRKLKLPASLSNQPGVSFRWRIVGDGTGTTGTLRLDDILVTARSRYDATVSHIYFNPQFPNAGDSVAISATILNAGTRAVQDIPLEFYEDANNDGIPLSDELFYSAKISQVLQSGDTIGVMVIRPNMQEGEHALIVRTLLPSDENPSNDVNYISLTVGLVHQSLVINELMYAPRAGPEWIELYNATTSPIDVLGWKLSARSSGPRYTVANSPTIISPHGYLIVTKDSSSFHQIYPFSQGIIVQSASLPEFFLNNNGGSLMLFDDNSANIDSIRYAPGWGGSDSTSLERIEPNASSTDSSNWGSCGDPLGSTPGRQNYLTPLLHNLRGVRAFARSNGTAISLVIQNIGREAASDFPVSLYRDANLDSMPQEDELIGTTQHLVPLEPGDSSVIEFVWNDPVPGEIRIIGRVDDPLDLRSSDNAVHATVRISFPHNTLVVNEIMYNPAPGQSEYVELLNNSGVSVDLRDWRIGDKADTSITSNSHLVSKLSLVIGPGEYSVVASDSSILATYPYLVDPPCHVVIKRSLLSLNNNGDDIIVSDLTGRTIDSVHYLPAWHNPELDDVSGRALERINPDISGNDRRNWSTSASPAGGTPGRANSLYTRIAPTSASLTFSPNPFSPDGDGFEDVTILSYQFPMTSGLLRVRIYDGEGRLMRTLADGEPGSSHGELVWDGYDDRRQRARIGIYVVLVEALDALGGEVQTVKGVVVVAARF